MTDANLEGHLAQHFSGRALRYFGRANTSRSLDRCADRATLVAALQRLALPVFDVALEIEERFGGIETDDDYQWFISVYEPIAGIPADAWLRRRYQQIEVVQVAACATSNLYVDEHGKIYEDLWELDLFVHTADALITRIERDALYSAMAVELGHGNEERDPSA